MKLLFKIKLLSLLAICLLNLKVYSQNIIAVGAPFNPGDKIVFKYDGGTGSATDWIGIYKSGQKPGDVSSTVWKYITSKSGEITFEGPLDAGNYDVHLFCCDGYNKIASQLNFQIKGNLLKSRMSFYKETDAIKFYITGALAGNAVQIYNANDFLDNNIKPGSIPIQSISLLNNQVEAIFDKLPPANYVGVLRENNTLKNFVKFVVKPTPILPDFVTKIGLSSCSSQAAPQPALENILNRGIDMQLFLGDNGYFDTYDSIALKNGYEAIITNRTEFQKVRSSIPIFATWDDHDYGCCDEDKDYPIKKQSQRIFNDFWEVPSDSPRRKRPGIYDSFIVGENGKRLQIILLDSRYFEDNKRPNNGCGKNDYCPWAGPSDANKTILGEAQWAWLKETLKQEADLRIIASSVQFGSSYHGFESWTLFPYERKKMQDLIKETKAQRVIFVSGDMHYSEVSKLTQGSWYPLYDFTASGINQSWPPEINLNRVENKKMQNYNGCVLEIDWDNGKLNYKSIDVNDNVAIDHTITFSEIENLENNTEHVNFSQSIIQAPSPGIGVAHILMKDNFSGKLNIYNLNGKLIFNTDLVNKSELTITNLLPGFYIGTFQSKNQNKSIKIFIE